jgi:hypothetical protein
MPTTGYFTGNTQNRVIQSPEGNYKKIPLRLKNPTEKQNLVPGKR